jgi:hypothetical protein
MSVTNEKVSIPMLRAGEQNLMPTEKFVSPSFCLGWEQNYVPTGRLPFLGFGWLKARLIIANWKVGGTWICLSNEVSGMKKDVDIL